MSHKKTRSCDPDNPHGLSGLRREEAPVDIAYCQHRLLLGVLHLLLLSLGISELQMSLHLRG